MRELDKIEQLVRTYREFSVFEGSENNKAPASLIATPKAFRLVKTPMAKLSHFLNN